MVAVVLFEFTDVFGPGFTDQDSVVLVRNLSQVAENDVNFRQLGVVNLLLVRIAVFVQAGKDRVIAHLRVFEQGVNSVEAEARDSAFVPPARDVEHGVLHGGIVPVQIRLLRIEIVIIKLSGFLIKRPRRSAKF